jgi:CsoR family transcriptional regulator, copper-sensing transcriptional repressor
MPMRPAAEWRPWHREAEMTGERGNGWIAEGRPALAPSAAGSQGRQAARQRLRSARGHLDAVLRMMETDRYCVDILHQLSAVEGAIARARRDILEGHLRGCVVEAVKAGQIEDVADEVLAAVFGDRPPMGRAEYRVVR